MDAPSWTRLQTPAMIPSTSAFFGAGDGDFAVKVVIQVSTASGPNDPFNNVRIARLLTRSAVAEVLPFDEEAKSVFNAFVNAATALRPH